MSTFGKEQQSEQTQVFQEGIKRTKQDLLKVWARKFAGTGTHDTTESDRKSKSATQGVITLTLLTV